MTISNRLLPIIGFPVSLYRQPSSKQFNGSHHFMLMYMGLEKTIAAATPQHREWMYMLAVAEYNSKYLSPQELAAACDPIADVPLHCMPAMLWIYENEPAAYQWILENLNRVDFGEMPMIDYMCKHGIATWGGWFTWSRTPQGYEYWEAIHQDYRKHLEEKVKSYEQA